MPNANDRKIIERFVNDSAWEMNDHELEELLDNELSKPADQMDMQLIRELMDVLQPGEVPKAQKEEAWQRVSRAYLSNHQKTRPLLRQFAVIAAIIVLLLGLTIGAASAFRWSLLWKKLQPIAETFGIYRNYSDAEGSAVPAAHQYTIEEYEDVQEIFYDLSMIPDRFMGYAIKPGWVPEGYEFLQATVYSDFDIYVYTLNYIRNSEEMNTSVTIYLDNEAVLSNQYERTVDIPNEQFVDSTELTFYRNAQDLIQVASWVDNDAHYYVAGNLTTREIEKIVEEYSVNKE